MATESHPEFNTHPPLEKRKQEWREILRVHSLVFIPLHLVVSAETWCDSPSAIVGFERVHENTVLKQYQSLHALQPPGSEFAHCT